MLKKQALHFCKQVLCINKNAKQFWSTHSQSIHKKKKQLHHVKNLPRGHATKEEILNLPSTPLISPSYPAGPYTFVDREYFIVTYETDPEKLRAVVPPPLKPAAPGNLVLYEWIKMPDSTGFGDYQESGTVIPCVTPTGEQVNFVSQMFLDCEPPIAAGREIWGFPKKYANPKMAVNRDTIYGTLHYQDQQVSVGTMAYKYKPLKEEDVIKSLTKTQVNLKVISDVNFQPKIAQLVKYNLCDVKLKFAYEGPARLALTPHINAPPADLPIRRVVGGKHILADIVLPYGEVLHDYLKEGDPHAASDTFMQEVLQHPVMPIVAPSYKAAPSHLDNREYFIIEYQSTADAIRKIVPDKLIPNEENVVIVQWINTNGTGLGDYNKFEVLIPCYDRHGNTYHYSVLAFLNSSAPITAGREIYGQPQKFGSPKISINRDTINGELQYSSLKVVQGTLRYKNRKMDVEKAVEFLSTPHMCLKLIPGVDGKPEIAQLVTIDHSNVHVHSAYESPAALELIAHANAPISDLPVVKVLGGFTIVSDLVLPSGTIYHDYLAKE